MKRILFCLFVAIGFVAKGQVYNNEWIDFTKTYYKFKLAKTGLHRISPAALSTAGLASVPAEQFQLWRNGVQIPIYTSVATGPLTGMDYIEFWAEMNDGKPDKQLYRDPAYQLNDKWSLISDSAVYFLTVNPAGNNFRLSSAPNNVSSNTLPVEPYFMHTVGNYFKNKINPGYAVIVDNAFLYSSSYDKGEGWSSADIASNGTNSFTFTNLFVYSAGPASSFNIGISGNNRFRRSYIARINGDSVIGNKVDFFNYINDSAAVPTSLLSANSAAVQVRNVCNETPCPGNDRMVVHKYELTYPRQFNFGGASNFPFSLPASATGNYLEITGFSYGSSMPVLYDLTNGKRYVAEVSGSLLKFALQASAVKRRLVLVSQEAANISSVTTPLSQRNFTNYSSTTNQGDYLIISNSSLFNGAGGTNPVEEYRAYRSSAAGGGHTAKIYLADQLVDQFGFGINKNPMGIRNFILFAKKQFVKTPKHVFVIGKGLSYDQQRAYESNPDADKLNFVPTFGYPASDILLSAEPGSSVPDVPIGRLSAINAQEVASYLDKMKETEAAQAALSPEVADRLWMKNIVHMVGSGDPGLQNLLDNNMRGFASIASDTLYGGKVHAFSKTSSSTIEDLNSTFLNKLFEDGISLMTYFGHSSSGALQFGLQNPELYNYNGKYPMFIALGCNAGNLFGFSTARFSVRDGLSEKYVLAPGKGMIGFVASTHFGIVHYLNMWGTSFYNSLSRFNYGSSVGEIMKYTAIDVFDFTSQDDFYARSNIEELQLHGDPAFIIGAHPKADYAVNDALVKINPKFISVADSSFKVDAKFYNIGKAPDKDIVVEIKRQYPNSSTQVVYRDTLPGIRYVDSISVNIRIDPKKDKGNNKIIITIDADNAVDEIYENNNTVTKDFVIYEDEARPVYPYNLSIVNRQNFKLTATTANALSASRQYQMELDTTELFNSPVKIVKTITTVGGIMEFEPGMVFKDSTVYYWRVAPVPASGGFHWNTASFIYLPNSANGFNQSHVFQHQKSMGERMSMDSASRLWKYRDVQHELYIRLATWVTASGADDDLSISLDGDQRFSRVTCWFSSLVFNVFEPGSFKPWNNRTINPGVYPSVMGEGLYGSLNNNCFNGRIPNFEYRYADTSSRRKMMDFMKDIIPDGAYVVVRNFTLADAFGYPKAYPADWAADTAIHGPGKSLYHYLKNAGFSALDDFNKVRQWAFVYKKGDPSYTPQWFFTDGETDKKAQTFVFTTSDTIGYINSPQFGPAKAWKELQWDGQAMETPTGDDPRIDIIGVKTDGSTNILFTNLGLAQKKFDISSVDPLVYPYVQLRMRNLDTSKHTPYQLKYWRLTYDPVPEGAVAPNIYFSMRDTVQAGDPIEFKVAFKNISPTAFSDSLKVKIVVTDKDNVQHVIHVKHRPLAANDTLHVRYPINTQLFSGVNNLFVDVNPDNDQFEQYHFNNVIYKDFYVIGDTLSPFLDVTFDNVHILNNDIVSSRPDILIRLKDESRFMMLDDTSLVSVKVRYPDGSTKMFSFNSDTLKFNPAQGSSENAATINFKPYFEQDGNYELIVSGKDKSDNQAGAIDYKVSFQVFNKPMISNMLNYPNPFTTSTAFVFTITGSEIPQNIKIQILTVTGKIVREITREELGPLRIGRNITEFKWDGTDQFGQKLGNGVYIYRVVTNLRGKSLDKYTSENDDSDKYFNKGYGKMYLMR